MKKIKHLVKTGEGDTFLYLLNVSAFIEQHIIEELEPRFGEFFELTFSDYLPFEHTQESDDHVVIKVLTWDAMKFDELLGELYTFSHEEETL